MRILSLGAGVQSSTLALMMAKGEIEPAAHAVFADTQAEPEHVYRWLDWLEPLLPFPVHRVTAGSLKDDFLATLTGEKTRCGQPPFFVRNPDNDGTPVSDSSGMLWRKCTKEYKLNPIRKKVRELSGGKPVDQIIGISLDEYMRMKPSRVKYITNVYPLVDMRITRYGCLNWMAEHYPGHVPPKSACYFCPYTHNLRWRDMKMNDPDSWKQATEFDDALRLRRTAKLAAGIKGVIFVHRSMTPLRDVDLRTATDMGQGDMFTNECEGMCGV
jgi:hypothetical protein